MLLRPLDCEVLKCSGRDASQLSLISFIVINKYPVFYTEIKGNLRYIRSDQLASTLQRKQEIEFEKEISKKKY